MITSLSSCLDVFFSIKSTPVIVVMVTEQTGLQTDYSTQCVYYHSTGFFVNKHIE